MKHKDIIKKIKEAKHLLAHAEIELTNTELEVGYERPQEIEEKLNWAFDTLNNDLERMERLLKERLSKFRIIISSEPESK
jgi:hypothetical protein